MNSLSWRLNNCSQWTIFLYNYSLFFSITVITLYVTQNHKLRPCTHHSQSSVSNYLPVRNLFDQSDFDLYNKLGPCQWKQLIEKIGTLIYDNGFVVVAFIEIVLYWFDTCRKLYQNITVQFNYVFLKIYGFISITNFLHEIVNII